MNHAEQFSYIVTVHNKEGLLPQVLGGIQKCSSPTSRIVVVLDGCTDSSENVATDFAKVSRRDVHLVRAPDVHEIKSINLGLPHTLPGYCVLLQDDMVLQEPELEGKIVTLNQRHNNKLGYLTFRMGADVGPETFWPRVRSLRYYGRMALSRMVKLFNYVGNPDEHLDMKKVQWGTFEQRMVGIKGPACLTPRLRQLEPLLDEALAPYCYDDVDLSLRSLKRGLSNGVYCLKYQSELDWGGTRKDPAFQSKIGDRIRLRNRTLIWNKHGEFIKQYLHELPANGRHQLM